MRLLGVSAENGRKLIITVVFILAVWLISRGLRAVTARLWPDHSGKRIEFWTRQGIQLVTALIEIIGILSIWFDNPGRLATFLGLFTAGLAFALQKVVTALAAYFVLLRGKTFNVGDRIRMGGVRGDVINLGFIQTTIMEMGEPPPVQNEEPAVWVQARQYTGRVVTVTNDKIFERTGVQLLARFSVYLGGDARRGALHRRSSAGGANSTRGGAAAYNANQ